MIEQRNLQYINLPIIPRSIINDYLLQVHSIDPKWERDGYIWSDSNNALVNEWCKANICVPYLQTCIGAFS